ncbi:unnamed protein product, partial [marine sediment metagenome]
LQDIITMELRDTFPRTRSEVEKEHPELREDPNWQAYISQGGGSRPQVYDWTVGGGTDINDALAEGTDYGPQSFASWYLGARKDYTTTFERTAASQGLTKYWAMKFWEAHWKLPDVGLARELLFRTEQVTPEMFRSILRWQDYPPDLLEAITEIAYNPLPRVDVRRMHLRGVLPIPDLFVGYLHLGYSPVNAARMTAFTVLMNAETKYRAAINAIRGAYVHGVIDLETAQEMMLEVYAPPTANDIPDISDLPLSEVQREAVVVAYEEISTQTAR